jgi:hypothetical protein
MATLSSYLTEVRRLLHDANGVFWSDSELTDDINDGRERVVRDTGCLRTLTIASTPIGQDGTAAIAWSPSLAVTSGQYIFSNIYTYKVTTTGTLGTTAPPYPDSYGNPPPKTAFTNGTAQLTYYAPCEIIPYSAINTTNQILDTLNVTIYWGNSRIPLRYMPWTLFNAQLRYWQNYVGRPVAFSIYGQQQIYIGPVPDQSYLMEVDTVILPLPLTQADSNAIDPINDPYTTPVAFYAAYKAKYKEQSYGEAEIYKQEYNKHVQAALNSSFTRRIPDPYSNPY